MTVHFIGAGPGAADLITLRGRDLLARCPVCLYAGSVVPPALLDYCPPDARRVDTAPLSLDEIEAEYVAADAAGFDVARLHSGDLSVWSAVAEQVRRLEVCGISWTLTPGVPAFAAAAAALGRELTIPEVAQSLVLTRVGGRASAMPPGETLTGFGATGATLAIHLAIHALPRIVADLVLQYGTDCPVAIVARASWPEERVVRGTLGTIEAAVAADPIDRTAIVFVGPGLAAEGFRESALYDAAYQRRFRGRGGAMTALRDALGRLAPEFPDFKPGHVWLAGAGPGRLGCLTLEVIAALAAADVVVYDALVDPAALRAADGAALHFVGKRRGQPSTPQAEINTRLVALARDGRRVLRLKGGDPNVFGRGGEEALALARARVPFRVLPGVTSAFAALAAARIPATQRGVSRALILATGHGGAEGVDWAALARTGQPIIVYMGLEAVRAIARALVAGGLPPATPAAAIASATCPEERIVVADLGSIAERVDEEGLRAPALIVVGTIVALRDELLAVAAEAAHG